MGASYIVHFASQAVVDAVKSVPELQDSTWVVQFGKSTVLSTQSFQHSTSSKKKQKRFGQRFLVRECIGAEVSQAMSTVRREWLQKKRQRRLIRLINVLPPWLCDTKVVRI